MQRETISLSSKEQKRLMVLNLVEAGEIVAVEAAERLRISLRHLRRLLARYRREGAVALAHGNRGRKPAIAVPITLKTRVLELAAQPCYAGCNDTHLSELLAEMEGIAIARATLRRWLRAAGRPSPRKRRAPRYRKCRQRVPRRGLLIQIDTSFHRWFENRGPELGLVAAIDDATGEVLFAHFREYEDTEGYFIMLAHILRTCGIPGAFYHDGRSTFVLIRQHQSVDDQLEGLVPQTQFGRALDELGVATVHARSPQAKGRIERLWNTFQDRLVIELRLAGVADKEAANAFLPAFLARYNRRFAQSPLEKESGFLPLPPNLDVDAVCCHHYHRTVAADNTVSVDRTRLQLPPGPRGRSYRRARVLVQHRLDGTWAIYLDGQRLTHPAPVVVKTPPRAPKLQDNSPAVSARTPAVTRPALNHPWRHEAALGVLKKQRAKAGATDARVTNSVSS